MIEFLSRQPALTVFLVIGVGYAIGRLRIAGIRLGASTGVLFCGLLLGHLGLSSSSGSQSVGFILFIYCVGLRAGPQFFGAFRENGIKFAILSVVVAGIGTAGAVLLGLGLPGGYRAGLLGGALTSTPTLVAAQDAVRDGLALLPPGLAPEAALRNIAASYAITYVVGLFGLVLSIAFLPRLLGIDLKAEARRLIAERGGEGGGALPPGYGALPVLRAYRVERATLVGQPLRENELVRRGEILPQRRKRGGAVVDVAPDTELRLGDLVAVLGPRSAHRSAQEMLGPEVVDDDLLEAAPERRTIVVTDAATRPALSLAIARNCGCAVVELVRSGMRLPVSADLSLEKGDLVSAVGLPASLDALAQRIGRSEQPAGEVDLITFAFGVASGIAIGLVTVKVGGIPVGLGTSGGLLLSGLLIGYARTQHPTFGQLPAGATTILMELGLQFFMANIGLEAGGGLLEACRAGGLWLPLSAFGLMLGTLLAGFAVGRLLLGLEAVVLLGALAGAMTSTPALDVLNREADSPLPTVGYAGTYAFANVLLAVAGAMLMRL